MEEMNRDMMLVIAVERRVGSIRKEGRMFKLTRLQMERLREIHQRPTASGLPRTPTSFLAFRRTVQIAIGGDCIMVPWAGMWLGIETDGYCHS